MTLPFRFAKLAFPSLAIAALFSVALAPAAKADLLELINGDHYRGIVISMTPSNVVFQSEIQGRVTLPRNKIAQITLHDVIPKPAPATNAVAATNAPLIRSGATPDAGSAAPPPPGSTTTIQSSAVVEQLRRKGVDPKLIDQVQEQIFGKSSPAASQKFNEMVGGLMSGSISVADIRKQALSGIAEIQAAKKELGPDAGDMLDGYLSILQNFVQQSATDTTITPPSAVTPNP